MTASSRRRFLKTAAAGALTGGALLLPGGLTPAEAAAGLGDYRDLRDLREHQDRHGHRHDHRHQHCACSGSGPGGGLPGEGSTSYSVTVVNDSSQFEDFTVYQTDPDIGVPQVMSLAWLVTSIPPQGRTTFTWSPDYSFVWGQTGSLMPGVVFEAAQSVPADPDDTAEQQIQFTFEPTGFTFQSGTATNSPQPGSLYIREESTVPLGEAAVGLGMSGTAAFVVAATPNEVLTFTPHPQYWVAAGVFERGQVLDTGAIAGPAQLAFGSGFALTATLQADGQWTVVPS